MRKEIVLCDSCGQEIDECPNLASPPLVGEGQNARAFSFDLAFHPMSHGSPPRSQVSKAGPAPDLCLTCSIAIVESALKQRFDKGEKDAAAKERVA